MSSVITRLINCFDDPMLGPNEWAKLLISGDTNTVFLTWQWQHAWWESFGRGDLLLITAERASKIVALAPFFSEAGMVFFVGSGGSDYLDFIGNISDPEILYALLKTARDQVPDFLGFRFYHVPNDCSQKEELLFTVSSYGGVLSGVRHRNQIISLIAF